MTTTKQIGTFQTFTGSLAPEYDVSAYIGDTFDPESQALGRLNDAYRAALQAELPAGVTLAGDMLIAEVDAEYDIDDIAERLEGVDLNEIVEEWVESETEADLGARS